MTGLSDGCGVVQCSAGWCSVVKGGAVCVGKEVGAERADGDGLRRMGGGGGKEEEEGRRKEEGASRRGR